MKKLIHKPIQDRFVAQLWLDDAIERAKKHGGGTLAYMFFTERMIKEKFRIQEWQLEYIGAYFNFKPYWAIKKYQLLLQQHK